MNKIKYDSDSMKLITLFESMSGAKIKDCIANEKLIFIVNENDLGKAIGRNGANIKKMESLVKKKIKVIEFSNDLLQFVRNAIYPVEVQDIRYEEGILTIFGKDVGTKAMLIGRERQNIHHLTSIARRYFDFKEIRVV